MHLVRHYTHYKLYHEIKKTDLGVAVVYRHYWPPTHLGYKETYGNPKGKLLQVVLFISRVKLKYSDVLLKDIEDAVRDVTMFKEVLF